MSSLHDEHDKKHDDVGPEVVCVGDIPLPEGMIALNEHEDEYVSSWDNLVGGIVFLPIFCIGAALMSRNRIFIDKKQKTLLFRIEHLFCCSCCLDSEYNIPFSAIKDIYVGKEIHEGAKSPSTHIVVKLRLHRHISDSLIDSKSSSKNLGTDYVYLVRYRKNICNLCCEENTEEIGETFHKYFAKHCGLNIPLRNHLDH